MDCARLAAYLAGLAAHNQKPWFEARRGEYQALRDDFTAFTGEVIRRVAAWDESLAWVDPADCLFRIYRDVRFSRDRSPYKTHFGALVGERGRRTAGPAYYFHVDHAGVLFAAGGVYAPGPGQLARIRAFLAAHPAKLQAVLRRRGFRGTFGEIRGERLKRPPRGYAADAPLLDLIRLKSFYVACEHDARPLDSAAALDFVSASFRAMHPLICWLREAVQYEPEPQPAV